MKKMVLNVVLISFICIMHANAQNFCALLEDKLSEVVDLIEQDHPVLMEPSVQLLPDDVQFLDAHAKNEQREEAQKKAPRFQVYIQLNKHEKYNLNDLSTCQDVQMTAAQGNILQKAPILASLKKLLAIHDALKNLEPIQDHTALKALLPKVLKQYTDNDFSHLNKFGKDLVQSITIAIVDGSARASNEIKIATLKPVNFAFARNDYDNMNLVLPFTSATVSLDSLLKNILDAIILEEKRNPLSESGSMCPEQRHGLNFPCKRSY